MIEEHLDTVDGADCHGRLRAPSSSMADTSYGSIAFMDLARLHRSSLLFSLRASCRIYFVSIKKHLLNHIFRNGSSTLQGPPRSEQPSQFRSARVMEFSTIGKVSVAVDSVQLLGSLGLFCMLLYVKWRSLSRAKWATWSWAFAALLVGLVLSLASRLIDPAQAREKWRLGVAGTVFKALESWTNVAATVWSSYDSMRSRGKSSTLLTLFLASLWVLAGIPVLVWVIHAAALAPSQVSPKYPSSRFRDPLRSHGSFHSPFAIRNTNIVKITISAPFRIYRVKSFQLRSIADIL